MGKKFFGMRGNTLNWAISTIAGTDFLLFGYDQGVMGGILTLPIFLSQFPTINPEAEGQDSTSSQRATYQGIAVASYNLGCFIGAVITIFGENLGGKAAETPLGLSMASLALARLG